MKSYRLLCLLLLSAGLAVRGATLEERIAALDGSPGEIRTEPGDRIIADCVIPANAILVIPPEAPVTVEAGARLQIDGGLSAGIYRLFQGSGSVGGATRIDAIRPEWFFDGAYDDETCDWAPAIGRAVAWAQDGVRKVRLLNRRYNVNSPVALIADGAIDATGMTFEGEVRCTQYEYGTLLIGNTGRGRAVIETGNADGVHLKNIGVVRGGAAPSDIGILQARCAGRMWAGDQYFENVYVNMKSDPTANNGFGTLGVVNIAGEETRYHNLQVWANLPVIISWSGGRESKSGDGRDDARRFAALRRTDGTELTDTACEIRSGLAMEPVDGYSNTVFVFSGLGRLVAYDYISPCVLINMAGMVDLGWTFLQKRAYGGDGAGFSEQNGNHHYAVEIWNCWQFNHVASVEGCRGYLLNRRGLYNATVKVTMAGSGEKTLPLVMLLDDGSGDEAAYHTNLMDCRFSFFTYDLERPVIATYNADGPTDDTRFRVRNSDIRINQPFATGKPNAGLLKNSYATAWYFSDGFLAPGSRDFTAE